MWRHSTKHTSVRTHLLLQLVDLVVGLRRSTNQTKYHIGQTLKRAGGINCLCHHKRADTGADTAVVLVEPLRWTRLQAKTWPHKIAFGLTLKLTVGLTTCTTKTVASFPCCVREEYHAVQQWVFKLIHKRADMR